MVDVSTSMALLKEGRANPMARANSRAPLDQLIYGEGDLSKVPVVPHALAVRRLLHADSRILHGRVPATATEKDFIRNGESLRPRDLLEEALKVKPLRQTPRVTTNFGNESSLAADALEAEVRAVRMQMTRQGVHAPTRAGAGACGASASFASLGGEPSPPFPAAGASGIMTDEDVRSLAADGPSPHPTYVMESEGLRAGMSSAGTIAKMLAQRPDAPSTASPAPAHHFMSGGSRSQRKKELRRAANREKLREANLELRKDQLVQRNLEMLQEIAAEEERAQEMSRALMEAVAPVPQAPPLPPILPPVRGDFEERAQPPQSPPPIDQQQDASPSPTPAAGSSQPAFLDSTAAKIGAAAVGGLIVALAAGAAVAAKRKKRRGTQRSR
jgi:hypothetical protein